MTGIYLLDWSALAVSIHNTILLLWLALTVALNAERRSLGIVFASASLVLATAFFVSHTVILVLGFSAPSANLDVWWNLGLFAVSGLPFGWYLVTLWYAGFWETRTPRWHQRAALLGISVLNLVQVALLIGANPLPTFARVLRLQLARTFEISGVPILFLVFALDIFLCVILSLDALRHASPASRAMSELARTRALPWLVATSGALMLVSGLVGALIAWTVIALRAGFARLDTMTVVVAWFDLIIALLVALAIIFVGQAITFYELFTGKILPRRGLFREWRSAVILAMGYGMVIAFALITHMQTIYIVLLTLALMTIFYALFTWRAYLERERYIRDLRPFVTSQRLYDNLVAPVSPAELDAAIPFRALCRDVLGARVAHLAPLGPLAPLVPALAYPEQANFPAPTDLAQFDSAQAMCAPIDPARNGGALWAIPLWSERGLIGVLRLGEKLDGGLYAQEEIEIARASGERLIDTAASAELARRLMALQRQRMTETQLLDRRARRVLHDDILPKLHAAILTLGDVNRDATDLLATAHRETSNLLREMPTSAAPEVARLGIIGALKQSIAEEWSRAFDSVEWDIEKNAEQAARALPTLTVETLFFAAREAIRNAARYGREDDAARALHLQIAVRARDAFEIVVQDDGIGLHKTKISDEGSGQGLALHSAMLAVVGGTLAIESREGTRVTIALPGRGLVI
ncbi:MAG: hypothetical protein HY868_19570 [Chloroflexi bacterium]|nr:hypothetical protein [Chloroflexota bacterium]